MTTRRVESFLLRIVVAEADPTVEPQWHGRIQHVGTGLECRVDELDEALAFITSHLRRQTGGRIAIERVAEGSAPSAP